MNPSYFRIKLPKEQALQRFNEWNNCEPKEVITCTSDKAVENSLNEDEQWKGACLYMYENEGWTVFEDLVGGYFAIPAEGWKAFARKDELIVAGYNDAIMIAEMIVISDGIVHKEFFEEMDAPDYNKNRGDQYPEIKTWMDVAGFVDDDDIAYSDDGVVLVY